MWFPGMLLLLVLFGAVPSCQSPPAALETVTAPDPGCPILGKWKSWLANDDYTAEMWCRFNNDGTLVLEQKVTGPGYESHDKWSGNFCTYDENKLDMRLTYDEIADRETLAYICATFSVSGSALTMDRSNMFTDYGSAAVNRYEYVSTFQRD